MEGAGVSVIAALQKMRAAGGGGAGVVGLPVELVGGLVVSGSRRVLIVCVDHSGVVCGLVWLPGAGPASGGLRWFSVTSCAVASVVGGAQVVESPEASV